MGALVKVTFYGDQLYAIRNDDGSAHVALKPIVEGMGLQWEAQLKRVRRDPILQEGMSMMDIPSTGGNQETVCLPLNMIPGWLMGVDANRVNETIRVKVIRYQRECYDVLAAHFLSGGLRTEQFHDIVPMIREMLEATRRIDQRTQRIDTELGYKHKPITSATRAEHRCVIAELHQSRCPIYPDIVILDANGDVILDDKDKATAEYDHHRGPWLPELEDTWLISRKAHQELTAKKLSRQEVEAAFTNYHWRRCRYLPPPSDLKVVPVQPQPEPIALAQPHLDLGEVEPDRAIAIAQIIYWMFNNVASIKQIKEVYARLRPDVENPGASVRNGILRQRAGSKEHLGSYQHKTTLFRLADGYDQGVTSCTEAGIEIAKRAGPLGETLHTEQTNK